MKTADRPYRRIVRELRKQSEMAQAMTDLQPLITQVSDATRSEDAPWWDIGKALLTDTYEHRAAHGRYGTFVEAGAWLDACWVLQETCLPGWCWLLSVDRVDIYDCELENGQDGVGGLSTWTEGKNPALTWLLAILKAIEAQQDG